MTATGDGADRALSIRAADPADLEILIGFARAMAAEAEGLELSEERLRAGIAPTLAPDGPARALVAERGGQTQGALMLTREWSDWRAGWFWWIQSVYVVPDARRTGVYSGLHERVLSDARSDPQVCGVRLYVERANVAAQTAYRRLGMQARDYDLYEVDFESQHGGKAGGVRSSERGNHGSR